MPNMGKPSQNCHLCRSRRVKVSSAYSALLFHIHASRIVDLTSSIVRSRSPILPEMHQVRRPVPRLQGPARSHVSQRQSLNLHEAQEKARRPNTSSQGPGRYIFISGIISGIHARWNQRDRHGHSVTRTRHKQRSRASSPAPAQESNRALDIPLHTNRARCLCCPRVPGRHVQQLP